MSIRIVCPSCRKVYDLSETMQGKTVRCRECQTPIAVPTLDRQGRRIDGGQPPDDRIAGSSRPASAAGRAWRDEDDEPRRRPDERQSRRKDKDSPGGKNLVPILVGVGVAAVLILVGLVVGGGVLVFHSMGTNSNETVAVANEPSPATVEGGGDAAAGPIADPAEVEEAAIPPGPVPAEMAGDVVQKVKQSTAYLRVRLPSGEVGEGSGFFALERGLVITNAHVVGMKRSGRPPRGVEIVMHSGEAGEAKLTGTLLGVDRDNDLAVLRVQGDVSRLPPPLPVASAAELKETQNVYIFGFPFGEDLGKNITVSKSAISSLRRGDNGVLKQVQVNGGMHPGNSGGPVADARGAVVGVSVAGIIGTQINFAVPGDFIRPLVQRSKSNPLDLNAAPGPLAMNDPPAGPAPGSGLPGDLAALKGTWESGPVRSNGTTGTVRLNINPQPGGQGGRIKVEIVTKQGGRSTSSSSTHSFTLEQKGGDRFLVTHIRQVGRRGMVRGMVFVYRFEGGQLVLSGAISAGRLGYTLQNVPLRRTTAQPEQAIAGNPAKPAAPRPEAGGKGKGSPVALKLSGDVYAFVEGAVREKRLTDVDIRGFTLSKNTYRDIAVEGGVLIGFQFGLGKFINNDIINSIRPIFLTKTGEKFGNWHGLVPAAPITVKARPGYVVSEISVRSALSLDALRLTFAKLGKEGLDLRDTYNGEVVGGNGGHPSMIDGKGALFIGVTGHLNREGVPCSLGLVAVLPKS